MVTLEFPQDKSTILQLLNEYFAWDKAQFTIQNGTVDVEGTIVLKKPTSRLPVKFGKVTGSFQCHKNQLESLVGSPHTVTENFVCEENKLESLAGCPQTVLGSFVCHNNLLTNLRGAPQKVGEDFIAHNNQLESLRGAPRTVGMLFDVSRNNLEDLEGAPQKVDSFWASSNKLTSLQGLSPVIPGHLIFDDNWKLESLEGLSVQRPSAIELSYRAYLPLLRLLVGKKVTFWPSLWGQFTAIELIFNTYAGQGKRAMFECQKALEDAGFSENARW